VFYHSRKISVDAVMALLSPPSPEHFFHLMYLGSGLFKHRIIHMSLTLTSELLIEMEDQSSRCSSYVSMLVWALKEAREQCAHRIKSGENNVKVHMKLSVVVSQAGYVQGDTSLTQQMAAAAKNSLQMSLHDDASKGWLNDTLSPRRRHYSGT